MEKTASSINNLSVCALIAAAGSGSRFKAVLPKQYVEIDGQPILRHTIRQFMACPSISHIKVIINPAHREMYEDAVKGLSLLPPVHGGKTRCESISKGLHDLADLSDDDIILIHDAARPFIDTKDINTLIQAVDKTGAATLAIRVADTLYNRKTGHYPAREDLYRIQTPQGFYLGLIKAAHETAAKSKKTYKDDTSVAAAAGADITLVDGHDNNIKITAPQDLETARTIMALKHQLKHKKSMGAPRNRIGSGFDVHAFTDEEKADNHVRLGGIDIPHPKSLKGHSDADVVLHALTDALLGALGKNDIGHHFPPAEEQWRNADSAVFLQKALKFLAADNGHIANIDITLICERPKIGPYKNAMKKNIADICALDPGQINIKATTTEGLGFTGRKEGIATQATVLVTLQ